MNPNLTANQEQGLRDVLTLLGKEETGLAICYSNTCIEHVMDSDLLPQGCTVQDDGHSPGIRVGPGGRAAIEAMLAKQEQSRPDWVSAELDEDAETLTFTLRDGSASEHDLDDIWSLLSERDA